MDELLGLTMASLSLAVGWEGWPLWWCIPLGYAMFASTYGGERFKALAHRRSVWLVTPAIAFLFMAVGSGAHKVIVG